MISQHPAIHAPASDDAVRAASDRPWDVVVVGAGPAGSAAAWSLSSRGARTLLIDRDIHPRGKVCGCCMGPLGLAALDTIGVLEHLASLTLGTVEIRTGGHTSTLPLPRTRAIPRDAMDAVLITEAQRAGATVLVGRRANIGSSAGALDDVSAELAADARDERRASVRVACADGDVAIQANAVIDARGLRAHAGSKTQATARDSYIGLGAVVPADVAAEGVLTDALRMIVEPTGYLGLAPLPGGGATLAAAVRTEALRSGTGQGRDGVLSTLLDRAGISNHEPILKAMVGVPTLRSRRAPQDGRVLRVGDAARFVEPITGEGMGWALAAGLAVGEHALAPERNTWAKAHAHLLRASFARCATISALTHRPNLLAWTLRSFGLAPAVRDRIVASAAGRANTTMPVSVRMPA